MIGNPLETTPPDPPVSPEKEKGEIPPAKQNGSLKGTLYSVFGLGLFLIISWLAIFILYLSRS